MRTGLILSACLLAGSMVSAQTSGKTSRTEYFEIYGELAVEEMHRSGVPASITLAQGALESGNGNSRLALSGKNHFGIKCHEDWAGKRIFEDDDRKNECFREYKSVEESFRDHSDYLRSTPRYDFLFKLDATDYKGWARGLKKAGYATSPSYADRLIEIIEEFELQKYDRMAVTGISRKRPQAAGEKLNGREILENNRVKYILAQRGDSYRSLTAELGKLNREIPGYNDAEPGDSLSTGQIVYIQPKRNKAEVGRETHVLQPGERMADISQKYAIKLSRLYELNRLDPGTEPANGTNLRLRKALREPQTGILPVHAPQGGEEEEEIKVDLNLE